jgi:saccharopine dehydrogenase (NAD+, L-lysine-forming)
MDFELNNIKIIYLRCELNNNEKRTPIIPNDIPKLMNNGFIVYVESSLNRIYPDIDYLNEGAFVTNKPWFHPDFQYALIVGLKEFRELDKLSNHKHLYFAHCYKNQNNSPIILNSFFNSKSIIYDFEYFYHTNKKRLISFGYYAGITGAIITLLHYSLKQSGSQLTKLSHWNNLHFVLMDLLKNKSVFENLNIGIVGANGNCGTGVTFILNKLGLLYNTYNRNSDKSNLKSHDILFNCIVLHELSTEIWFDKNTIFDKNIVISDISCDYSKPNNPISVYSENTTWENPVFQYNDFVDIIAINNLPSLLPKESSDFFSSKCVELVNDIHKDENSYWKNNENVFYDKFGPL